MDNNTVHPTNTVTEIERRYQEFLHKLDLLKKERDMLIEEYGAKLELRKLSHPEKQKITP